jgi:predicted nucleic acid-binding protein
MLKHLLVETNFLVELVLGQEQAAACQLLLNAAEEGRFTLHIPAFCLMEVVHKLMGEKQSGTELEGRMALHLKKVQRESPDVDEMQQLERGLITVFELRNIRHQEQLFAVSEQVLAIARQIPLTAAVFQQVKELRDTTELTLPDACVAASLLSRVAASSEEEMLFVSRDVRAFRSKEVRSLFEERGCDVLFDFEHVGQKLRL